VSEICYDPRIWILLNEVRETLERIIKERVRTTFLALSLSNHLSIHPSIHPSIDLSIYLSIYVSVSVSTFLDPYFCRISRPCLPNSHLITYTFSKRPYHSSLFFSLDFMILRPSSSDLSPNMLNGHWPSLNVFSLSLSLSLSPNHPSRSGYCSFVRLLQENERNSWICWSPRSSEVKVSDPFVHFSGYLSWTIPQAVRRWAFDWCLSTSRANLTSRSFFLEIQKIVIEKSHVKSDKPVVRKFYKEYEKELNLDKLKDHFMLRLKSAYEKFFSLKKFIALASMYSLLLTLWLFEKAIPQLQDITTNSTFHEDKNFKSISKCDLPFFFFFFEV